MTHTMTLQQTRAARPQMHIGRQFAAVWHRILASVKSVFADRRHRRAIRDLSPSQLQDIALTVHDVSWMTADSLSAKEALQLAELRQQRSSNW